MLTRSHTAVDVASVDMRSLDAMMIDYFAKDKVIVGGQSQTVPGGGAYCGSVAVVTRLRPDGFPLLDS